MTTDELILGSCCPSTRFGVPGERTRVHAVPLAWSAALRVCRSILLEASIEYVVLFSVSHFNHDLFLESDETVSLLEHNYGRILTKICPVEYWCRLLSSVNFAEHLLKSCVNIIHVDLVEIWNLNDKIGVGFLPYMLRLLLMGPSISRAMCSKLRYLTSSEI